ncbi:MAG: hypothetical protein ACNA8W_06470 [Bradymonadaceae bacterium]
MMFTMIAAVLAVPCSAFVGGVCARLTGPAWVRCVKIVGVTILTYLFTALGCALGCAFSWIPVGRYGESLAPSIQVVGQFGLIGALVFAIPVLGPAVLYMLLVELRAHKGWPSIPLVFGVSVGVCGLLLAIAYWAG